MKKIIVNLSKDIDHCEIIPLADLHIGDSFCDLDLIKETIDYIKNNKNVYCILNGDIINNSTKTSVGDVYSDTLNPMSQVQMAIELFEPIKDKILLATSGNHEIRTWKTDGIDLTAMMCLQLNIPYSPTSAILFLRLGENSRNKKRQLCYTIYVSHGTGGGKKEGSKINSLADMSNIIDADIYIHSHTHLPAIFKNSYYRVDTRSSTIALVDKLYVNTNAYLNYGGYGETLGFKPSSKAIPHIYISGIHRKATAKI